MLLLLREEECGATLKTRFGCDDQRPVVLSLDVPLRKREREKERERENRKQSRETAFLLPLRFALSEFFFSPPTEKKKGKKKEKTRPRPTLDLVSFFGVLGGASGTLDAVVTSLRSYTHKKIITHSGTATSLSALTHSLNPPFSMSTFTWASLPQMPALISSYAADIERLCVPFSLLSLLKLPPMLQ